MSKLGFRTVEDINISFNQNIHQYVIDISYRDTDREGNVDIISIRDLPIPIFNYPNITHNFDLCGCDTKVDLGFGDLDFHPKLTRMESRRIYTVTKEMTLEEIEKKLGYKVKIVSDKEE